MVDFFIFLSHQEVFEILSEYHFMLGMQRYTLFKFLTNVFNSMKADMIQKIYDTENNTEKYDTKIFFSVSRTFKSSTSVFNSMKSETTMVYTLHGENF